MRLVIILLFIIFSIISIIDKGRYHRLCIRNISILFFIWIILVLISAFRSNDMPDYENYYNFLGYGYGGERWEIGFKTYVGLLKKIHTNPIFLFAVIAALTVGIKLLAIRKMSNSFWLSMVVYISGVFILHDMIQIRAAAASGLLLWATKYAYERNLKKFLIIGGVAMLFHYSAIIIFPIWFISTTKTQRWFYMSLIPLSFTLAIAGFAFGHMAEFIPIPTFQAMWKSYQLLMENGEHININVFNSLYLLRCAICIFLLLNINTIARYSKIAILWVKIYTISLIIFALLSDIPVIAFRISELYQIVEVLLLPTLILIPSYRNICKYIIIAFSASLLFIYVFYNSYIS